MKTLIIIGIIIGIIAILCAFVITFIVLTLKDDEYLNYPETWVDDEGNEYLL